MKARLFLPVAFLVIFPLFVSGQALSVHGKVTDENGAPLPGAGITVLNTYSGTYSGADGSYTLKLPARGRYSLRFSFTGYETAVYEIDLQGDETLDVQMKPATFLTDEVLVTATRAGYRTPVTYSVVTGEELKKLNLGQELPFMLALTPSLVETSEAGTGIGYTAFRIRGTDPSRINVTVDGIPLNDAESQQVFWVDLPDLASSVENIQVQRGVGTSANGAGAFGASVNIMTRTPSNEPFAGIGISAGSFNTFRKTLEAGTGLLPGNIALQIRYSDIKSDGYIRRTGCDNRSAVVTGVWKTGSSLLKANVILGEEHTGISWWGVPSDKLSTDRRYNPAGEYTDDDGKTKYYDNETDNYWQNHYRLLFSTNITDNLNFNAALHYTYGKGYYEEFREDQKYSKYGLSPVKRDTSYITKTDLIRRKWMSNDFYGIVYSLNYTGNNFRATVGGGVNRHDGDHFGKIIWMRYAGDTPKDFQWYFNNGTKDEFSIYGKVNLALSPGLSGFGDLQYRYISYDITGNDSDLKNIAQSHKFSFFNPKAGLFWSVAPNQDAYLSFSVAHREPTRSDFKEAAGDENATPRPETLYDLEAGYNLRSAKLQAGINFFGMFYDDQLVPTGEISSTGYEIMTNVEKSYRTGVELTAAVKPAKAIDWNFNLTLSSNKIKNFILHYIDYNTSDWSEEYKSKELGTTDIAYSPSVISSSDIGISVAKNLSAHLISKYVGRQYFDNTSSRNRMIDPYFVNNLRIDYSPEIKGVKNTGFQLLISNLFNTGYESNAYGGLWYEDGKEKTWAYYFPQAGISFMISALIEF